MRLSPTAFNRHLAHIGQQVTWRRAYSCACRNPVSGAPDTKCPHCGGKGQLWLNPVPTVCGVASQKTQAKWAASGRWTDGDVVVTIPGDSPMWGMSQFDRVLLMNAAERFSQSLVRGAVSERLLHSVKQIDRVFWLAPVTRDIVEGGIPTFDANGRLTWSSGEPPPGATYSITGQRLPEYWCFDNLGGSRNEHSGAVLPNNVVLRRWDLWGRSSPNL